MSLSSAKNYALRAARSQDQKEVSGFMKNAPFADVMSVRKAAILDLVTEIITDLVVLARYIADPVESAKLAGRCINIHHSCRG